MTEPMPMPPPEKAAPEHTKDHKSKGEKLFDRITYVGIAGIGTFIVTVPLAYELEHHSKLKPYFERAIQFVENAFAKLNINLSHDTAHGVVKTTTLMQGGNLMVLPVGLMEHYKVPIVRGFNAMLGDKSADENITEAPKQTVMSLVKSRALAWLMVFGSLTTASKFYKRTMDVFEEETGALVCKILRRDEKRLNPGKLIEDTRTYGYGKIAALDVFATAAAATLLYVGGHFFARKQEEKKEQKLERKLARAGMISHDVSDDGLLAKPGTPDVLIAGAKTHVGVTHEHTRLLQH